MTQVNEEVISEIRDSVRKIALKELPKYETEKYYGKVPRELFSSFAEIGLTGLTIDENYGGLGLGAAAAAAVMEELSAVNLGPAIFLSVHLMTAGILQRTGSEEQKSKYLPRMVSGEILGAFALTESSAGSDAANLKTTAKSSNGSYVLNGEKCWITSAGFADLYITFAKSDPSAGSRGISAFLVDGDSAGLVAGTPETKMGCELSPISTLAFESLEVSEANRLKADGDGYGIALGALAGGRINIAACANGLSRTAIKLAKQHLEEREQYGKKLIEFQGLQFMLADMRTSFEAARLLTEQAAYSIEQDPGAKNNRIRPSMAKCFATDAAMKITTDAVQLLGGAGYVREYKVERLMRDAKMLQIVEGTNQIQRVVIARELREEIL